MATDDDARNAAFYDHESDQPSGRRRRAAADWGVNEDIFDRMPSRRFTRADRRAEHRDDEPHRFERRVSGPAEGRSAATRRLDEPSPAGGGPAPRAATGVDGDMSSQGRSGPAPRQAEFWVDGDEASPSRRSAPARRPAESWMAPDAAPAGDQERRVESWLEPEPPASRTIVLSTEEPVGDAAPRTIVLETGETDALLVEPPARRTVVIKGHPERNPAARPPRPPRTAVERIGTSPDRIVAYAVALGFLLVLIAVLTTGQ